MNSGMNNQIDQTKQQIQLIKNKIKKEENQLQLAKRDVKEKNILFNKIVAKFKEYSKESKEMSKQYKQIASELTKVKQEEYDTLVLVQQQQYEVQLIDYEVDKKACEKAPFTTKQQFCEFIPQDQVAYKELQQIESKKKSIKVQQQQKVSLTKKIEQIQPRLQNTEKELNKNSYQKQYYEYMMDDLKVIIRNKQMLITQLKQSIDQSKYQLQEQNYNLSSILTDDLNFHKCPQKH